MEFRIMTYNIYGARLADGKKLAESVKKNISLILLHCRKLIRIREEENFGMWRRILHLNLGIIIIIFKKRWILIRENLELINDNTGKV